jgi:hypothetical protein
VRRPLLLATLAASALFSPGSRVLAGEPPAPAPVPVNVPVPVPVPVPGLEQDPWDDVVFLPESGLSVLLERDPKGVLLDRATYLDLHRRARAARGDLSAAPGAWKALVARADVEATLDGERLRARVRMAVAVRGGGRETVALPAAGAAVSATLDGAPATLGASADGKWLLLSVQGDGFHEAVVDLVAPVERKAGTRSVALALPPALALRWMLLVPGRVTATVAAAASRVERLENPDRTRITAYPGAKDPSLRLSWREGDEGTDLPPVVTGVERTLVEAGERSLSIQTVLRIQVQRRPESIFPLVVPPGLTILGIDSESPVSLSGSLREAGVRNLVFPEPFTGVRTVVIRASRPLPGPGTATVDLPRLAGSRSVDRRLAIRFVEGLRGLVDAGPGAVREESAPVPGEGAVDAVLRLTGTGDETVSFRTERPSARVEADLRAVVDLAEDGPWIAASFLYRPRNDRLYGVEPRLPPGFTPDAVGVSGDVPHFRSLSPDGRLSVVFPGGIEPGGAVAVTVRGRLPAEGWLSEDWKERTVAFPRLDPGPVDGAEARLGVAAPPDLDVREEDAAGMEPAAVSELRERAGFTTEGLTLGYRHRGGIPGGSVRAVRRPPSVTAVVGVLAGPEEDHLRTEASVTLSVQRSGIREVRIVVRPAAGDDLRIEGPDVAERRRIPGNGFDTWVVRFSRRVRDRTVVLLRADRKLVDGGAVVPIPSVEGAARQDLFVGLEGGGELEVAATAKGLRDADPADLAPALGPRAAGLLEAWKGERGVETSLSVKVRRLDPADLPPVFADRVRLVTMLAQDGVARTRVVATVRNADRQALEVTLPDGASLQTARVRGEAVRPLVLGRDRLQVPLVRSPEPFEVVLVYEEALDEASPGEARLRAPDLGLAGGMSTWIVRLPDGSVAVETSGDFAARPRSPATPILARFLRSLFRDLGDIAPKVSLRGGDGGAGPPMDPPPGGFVADADLAEMESAAEEGAPPAPAAPAVPEVNPSFGKTESDDESAKSKADVPMPTPEKKARERIAGRATREGLFGMDLRLLEAGPAVTAARLSPGGRLALAWRTASARRTGALLAGILAFAAGWLARRRGIGTPTWTVLALGLVTAAPVVLGAVDGAAWDGAALGTAAWALVAILAWVHRKDAERARRKAASPATPAAARAALLVGLLVLAPAAASAADEKAPPQGRAAQAQPDNSPGPPPAPTVVKDPGDTVFVPYDPKRPETLKTPERVFLPYARYVELWNAAHPEERIEPARPPVVVVADYRATVDGRILVVEAGWLVDPVDGGLVPLPPGAAVEELTLDGKPATAASLPGGAGVVLAVPKGAKAAERRLVRAVLRFPIEGREPGGAVKAAIPPAARTRLQATLPVPDAVVSVRAGGGWTSTTAAGATVVDADLGPVGALEIAWTPKGADAAGGRVRFEAATTADLVLREGRALLAARTVLEIRSGTLEGLDFALPPDWEPTAVSGTAVVSWTATGVRDGRRLLVRLAGAGPGSTEVLVQAVFTGPALGAEFAAPDLAVAGAATETSTIRAAAGRGWRLTAAEASAFERVETGPADRAAGLDPARGERVQAAWRRSRLPARLSLRTEALPRALEVRSRQHLLLGGGFSLLRADFDLVPGPEGLFEAAVALPAGWTLEESEGGAAFAADGRLRIVLGGAPSAPRTVVLRLRGPAAGDAPLAFPRLRVDGAVRESDELLVSTLPAWGATAVAAAGLDSVPVERFAGWPALDPSEKRALAWRAPRGGGDLSLRREALRPTVRPTIVADVTVLDDRAIVDALMVWDVRGGPLGTFRFRSPAGVKDAWVVGDGLREVRTVLEQGREVTTVTLQAPATGEVLFRVLYEVPVPAGGEASVRGPEPLDGEAARAFLFVRAAGDAEARLGESPGLEPCDVADLPKIPSGLDPRRVLRFFRARDAAWGLPLRLVSHETGAIPEARILLVEATTVVDRDGSARTRVEARLFNRARAFLPVEAPAGWDLEAVTVSGVPVRPVTKKEVPGVLVPVRRQSLGDESQVVSLIFASGPLRPGGRFETLSPRLPVFPGVPVDATTWRLLLPEDRAYSFSGNLDPVEEIEIEIARAEAYAHDVSRLRKVVSEGSVSQQALAGENILRNTDELRKTLDRAQSRMDDLERAAADGRIDQARVAESRRKAVELNKEIEDALKDVRDKAPQVVAEGKSRGGGHGGQYRGPASEMQPPEQREPSDPPPQSDDGKLATREGQTYKQWKSNEAAPEGQEKDRSRSEAEKRANIDTLGKAETTTVSAFLVHQDFDRDLRADVGLLVARPATPDTGGGTPTPPEAPAPGGGERGEFYQKGVGGAGGGAGGAHEYAGRRAMPTPVTVPAGALAGTLINARGYESFGALALPARPAGVAGVISLAPAFEESGRAYAFRKLDAGAEITIKPGTLGLGRRIVAGALFAALCGLVYYVKRRQAR